MKLSNETMEILKHFATLNPAIMIEPNEENRIYSAAETKALVGTCILKETFEKPFITTDLGRFLSVASLFTEPDFEFGDDSVRITSENGAQNMVFYYAPAHLVNQKNKLPKKQEDVAIEFCMSKDAFSRIRKASDVMGVSDIRVKAANGKITLSCLERKMATSNSFDLIVGDCDPELDVDFYFKKQNLRLTEDDYSVVMYKTRLVEFIAQNKLYSELRFFVVAEADDI